MVVAIVDWLYKKVLQKKMLQRFHRISLVFLLLSLNPTRERVRLSGNESDFSINSFNAKVKQTANIPNLIHPPSNRKFQVIFHLLQ